MHDFIFMLTGIFCAFSFSNLCIVFTIGIASNSNLCYNANGCSTEVKEKRRTIEEISRQQEERLKHFYKYFVSYECKIYKNSI